MSMVTGIPGPDRLGNWTSLGNGDGYLCAKPETLMGSHEILLRAAHDNDARAVARLYRERESRLYGYDPSTARTP